MSSPFAIISGRVMTDIVDLFAIPFIRFSCIIKFAKSCRCKQRSTDFFYRLRFCEAIDSVNWEWIRLIYTMALPSRTFFASFVVAFLLVKDSFSFQLGKPLLHPLDAIASPESLSEAPRRDFLNNILKGAVATCMVSIPTSAQAAEADILSTGAIKVTAIAHTFVTTGKSASPSVKPIRENDATRFFTNARVVYIFDGNGNGDSAKLAQEVIDLTQKRKAEQGPGVTPGNLSTLQKGITIDRVVQAAKELPDGDVLLVGPIPSQGTQGDGKLLQGAASGLGTFVGGQKGGGVISVLLNGPKENLKLVESGYPASELLWYSLPPKP